MDPQQNIKEEIKKKIEQLPPERLSDVLEFVKQLEGHSSRVEEILSFAGIFAELDDELLDNLTTKLHQQRMKHDRQLDAL